MDWITPQAMVVDSAGDVYVTGITKDRFGVWNCVTLKYTDYVLYTPPPDFEGAES